MGKMPTGIQNETGRVEKGTAGLSKWWHGSLYVVPAACCLAWAGSTPVTRTH